VTQGEISSAVAATGTCNAVVTVQVGSQVSGNIKALFADFNTKVTKGQLVATIDPEIFQAKVNQARANVDSARAAVANAEAVATKAEADIANAVAARENAKAQLAKVQADLRDAGVKLKRRLAELEKGLIATEDADTAQATFDANSATVDAYQAQIRAADSNVKAMEAQHEVAVAQVESAAAQVRQLQAALAQAELDLAHTKIIAPVEGTVIARHMDVGQTVAASLQAPTIFEIAQDLTRMQVDTNVDESDIGRVKVGQTASFTVDAYPNMKFPSVVSQIRQSALNMQNVITYDVVLSVDNTELRLLPGMTANVRILTDSLKDALKVPNAALRFRPPGAAQPAREAGAQTVYTLSADGTPRAVRVTVRLSDGTFTAVSSGDLRAGDKVIVSGGSGSASTAAATARPQAAPRGF
jgi:HlyD family secretion protein